MSDLFKFDNSTVYMFEWPILWHFKFEIEIALDAFSRLHHNQEQTLEDLKEVFVDNVDADPTYNSFEGQMQSQYYNQIFESEEMTIKEIQRQQRYAICLSIFSFYEGRLKAICGEIEKEFDYVIKIDDLNSKDGIVGKYWKYLMKVHKMSNLNLSNLFEPIQKQRAVRNYIAHQAGTLTKEQAKQIHKIKGIRLKETADTYIIELNGKSYIPLLLKYLDDFFKGLLLECDKRYKDIKNISLRL